MAPCFDNFGISMVEQKTIWRAVSAHGTLDAIAGLNTRAAEIGQVGGVFASPEVRGQGVARAMMRMMTRDVAALHKIKKLVLFTGDNNYAAQRLYQGLGYQRCSDFFGMVFA